jgi:origin recognition complex subunit 2
LAEDDGEDGQGDWDGEVALAKEILGAEEVEEEEEEDRVETDPAAATTPSKTPGKRGRPKGAKNRRSPTPEGDIAPEERYFFQTRGGPPQVSSNKFTAKLAPDEYSEHLPKRDHHEAERRQLLKLHARSFPQWRFELRQGLGVCLYGYGSKRRLTDDFAEYMYGNHKRIVVVNGYTAKLNVRTILNTVASAVTGEDHADGESDDDDQGEHEDQRRLRLVGPPQEMLDTLLARLGDHPVDLVVVVNSIDAPPLRRPATQAVLARLAAHPLVQFVCTADTPTFPVLWNSTLLDQFAFVYHDCTTFAPYTAEMGNPVDEVHELLGRKRARAGGKEGVGFVLRSLPENARNLYKLLLSEILHIMTDGVDEEDEDGNNVGSRHKSRDAGGGAAADELGVEYRVLYQKASTDFICSSSMNFQFLLKEFHDHQLITSRRDATGTELLGVPLAKEEMEAVLEDLGGL